MKSLYLLILLLSLQLQAQMRGCTDPLSKNFNPTATVNDGSCVYASESIKPVLSVEMPEELDETSGLIQWGSQLYTHNDDTDTSLYTLDTLRGVITQKIAIKGVENHDWEELAQDSIYIYIGDFGNNSGGNRDNLKIIRIRKDSLTAGTPNAEYIHFSYSDQADLTASGGDNTNFDCEAMVVSRDSIYLFTKQWKSLRSSLYALPKTPGIHVAQFKAEHDVSGLITGATYLEKERLVVLTGYNMRLKPFFYLLYDFNGHNFFSGNKRKVNIRLPFHQVEGITTVNGLDFYITNERITRKPIINIKQQLHKFDLSTFLKTYFEMVTAPARRN